MGGLTPSPFLFLIDMNIEDLSYQVGVSVTLCLAFFPLYFVLGFGHMGIRLAKWAYNRNKAQMRDILSSLSSTLTYLKFIPMWNQTQRGRRVS